MKKIIAFILVLSMAALLVACGSVNEPETTTEAESVTEGIASTELPTETFGETESQETTIAAENTTVETTKASGGSTNNTTKASVGSTDNTTKAASNVSFPITKKNGNGTLTVNNDGTYSYNSGTVSLNNSVIGTVYGSVTAGGSYKVTRGSFSMDYGIDNMTLHCNKEDNSQLNLIYQAFIPKLNGSALTNHSSASVSNGKLVVKMIAYNGTDEYPLTTHTFTVDETKAILALGQ